MTALVPKPTSTQAPSIAKGSLICIRVYDFGDEVKLDRAEEALRKAGKPCSRRNTFGLDPLAQPLGVPLGKQRLQVGSLGELELEVTVDFYTFGNASVVFEWSLKPGTPLESLIPVTTELMESPVLHAAGRAEGRSVRVSRDRSDPEGRVEGGERRRAQRG